MVPLRSWYVLLPFTCSFSNSHYISGRWGWRVLGQKAVRRALTLLFSYTVLRGVGQGEEARAFNPALVPAIPIIPSSRIFSRCALRHATSTCHCLTVTPAQSASFACTLGWSKLCSKTSLVRFHLDKRRGRTPGK